MHGDRSLRTVAWGWGRGDGSVETTQAWGREHGDVRIGTERGDRSVGMGAIFFYESIFKKNMLHRIMKMIDFFVLAWKHRLYEKLFDLFSVFRLHIFVEALVWGWEQFFLCIYFQKNFIVL